MKKRRSLLFALGIMLTLSMTVPAAATENQKPDMQPAVQDQQDAQQPETEEENTDPQWEQITDGQETKWTLKLSDDEKAQNGAYSYKGKVYWFDENGYLVTGFVKVEQPTAGDTAVGKTELQAGIYYFQKEGEKPGEDDLGSMLKDQWAPEQDEQKAWHYFDPSGRAVEKSGWQQPEEEWYYLKNDGTIDESKSGWFKLENDCWIKAEKGIGNVQKEGWYQIDSKWYYLDQKGVRDTKKTGLQQIDGEWYCLNDDGSLKDREWIKTDGQWYWIEAGKKATGWRTIKGKKYYLNPSDGKMLIGAYKAEDGKLYYSDDSGALVEKAGWNWLKGTWYWMNTDGSVATDWYLVNGTWYYSNAAGAMQTGWLQLGNTWYFLKDSGAMQTGWLKRPSGWYYLSGSGAMATGWYLVNGTWYYSNAAGTMQTGWLQLGNTWYFLKDSGAMQTGWLKRPSGWYYLTPSGAMATEWYVVNGAWYYSNAAGTMQTGWIRRPSGWYYLSGSGAMATGWQRINGVWYYLNPGNGDAVTGWKYIGQFKYYFNSDCKLVQDLDSVIGRQSSYKITINRKKCQVMVYAKSETGRYDIPVKTFTCSVGKSNTPTHVGTYQTLTKANPALLMGPSWGKYGTQINAYGDWFHSVACSNPDPTFALSAGNYNMLGQPASHGCVRLCVRDAKWIYENCGLGTTVVISDTEATPFDRPATIKIPASQHYDPTDTEALNRLNKR